MGEPGVDYEGVKAMVSQELIAAVVKLRSVKDQHELSEIEKAVDVAAIMHTTAMKMAYPGNFERELAGAMEGIALSHGGPVSFPVILSMDGQTLHNHYHGNELSMRESIIFTISTQSCSFHIIPPPAVLSANMNT